MNYNKQREEMKELMEYAIIEGAGRDYTEIMKEEDILYTAYEGKSFDVEKLLADKELKKEIEEEVFKWAKEEYSGYGEDLAEWVKKSIIEQIERYCVIFENERFIEIIEPKY